MVEGADGALAGEVDGPVGGHDVEPPAVVLVHGGGATGRTWDRLVPLIDGPVLAVDLPGRGDRPADLASITVDDEVSAVVADVEAATGAGTPIVLVAHSSGGLVVPGVVAALGDRVRHVVLLASLVPPEGGRGIDCMRPSHREGLIAAVEAAEEAGGPAVTLPGAPADAEPFRTAYGGDPLGDEELAFVVDPVRCVPDTVHHYFQPVRWSTASAVPVTYLHTTADRPVRPDAQRSMIGDLPGPVEVVELPTGHLPMVTHPHLVAEVLTGIVGKIAASSSAAPPVLTRPARRDGL